jgi:hypothetical protein
MKKIFATMMLLVACTAMQAQTADKIFQEFKNAQGAEYVPISKEMLSKTKDNSVSLMGDKIQMDEDLASTISSMQVLDLGDCSKDIKGFVSSRVNALKDHGYETVLSANDGGENTLILSKMKGDKIVEVLIFSIEKDDKDCSMVQFKGSISKEALMKEMGNDDK